MSLQRRIRRASQREADRVAGVITKTALKQVRAAELLRPCPLLVPAICWRLLQWIVLQKGSRPWESEATP